MQFPEDQDVAKMEAECKTFRAGLHPEADRLYAQLSLAYQFCAMKVLPKLTYQQQVVHLAALLDRIKELRARELQRLSVNMPQVDQKTGAKLMAHPNIIEQANHPAGVAFMGLLKKWGIIK